MSDDESLTSLSREKEESSDGSGDDTYKPEVLPSLLVDVTPNEHDIEKDTLLPYFVKLKEKRAKKRAEKIAKYREREAHMQAEIVEMSQASGLSHK